MVLLDELRVTMSDYQKDIPTDSPFPKPEHSGSMAKQTQSFYKAVLRKLDRTEMAIYLPTRFIWTAAHGKTT